MSDQNNFLRDIITPDITNPEFASQFDNFCSAVRDNFEKLLAVQVLKGDTGTSIIPTTVHVFSEGACIIPGEESRPSQPNFGTQGGEYTFEHCSKGYTQQIYTKEELIESGLAPNTPIKGLSFKYCDSHDHNLPLEVYIKMVPTGTNLSEGFYTDGPLTKVFSNSDYTWNSVREWNNIIFQPDVDIVWDGESDMLVAIYREDWGDIINQNYPDFSFIDTPTSNALCRYTNNYGHPGWNLNNVVDGLPQDSQEPPQIPGSDLTNERPLIAILTTDISPIVPRHLTEFGAAALNAIFEVSSESEIRFQAGDTLNEVITKLNGTDEVEGIAKSVITGGRCAISIEQFDKLELIAYRDPINNKAYLSNPLVFIDNRIPDLRVIEVGQEVPEAFKLFIDYSCSVIGTAEGEDNVEVEEWDWSMSCSETIPKIYYDDDICEFCWMVNGQKTHVTAQGIKGNPGNEVAIYVGLGQVEDKYLNVKYIEKIEGYGDDIERKWYPVGTPQYNVVNNGDLILVFYPLPTADHPDIFPPLEDTSDLYLASRPMGVFLDSARVVIDTDNESEEQETSIIQLYFQIVDEDSGYIPRIDAFWSIRNQVINYIFDVAGYRPDTSMFTGNTEILHRGLYLNDGTGKYHLFYQEYGNDGTSTGRLRFSPVDNKAAQNLDPWNQTIGDLRIDYNIETPGNLSVQGTTNIQGALQVQGPTYIQGTTNIQGALTVQGDTYLQGTISVQHIEVRDGSDIDNRFQNIHISGSDDEFMSFQVQGEDGNYGPLAMACINSIENFRVEDVSMLSMPNIHSDRNISVKVDSNIDSISVLAYKMTIGMTFNLHLKLGYLGFGKDLACQGCFDRTNEIDRLDYTGDKGHYGYPGTGSLWGAQGWNDFRMDNTDYDLSKEVNLYNVCEYDIPCHILKDIYLGSCINVSPSVNNDYRLYFLPDLNIKDLDSNTPISEDPYSLFVIRDTQGEVESGFSVLLPYVQQDAGDSYSSYSLLDIVCEPEEIIRYDGQDYKIRLGLCGEISGELTSNIVHHVNLTVADSGQKIISVNNIGAPKIPNGSTSDNIIHNFTLDIHHGCIDSVPIMNWNDNLKISQDLPDQVQGIDLLKPHLATKNSKASIIYAVSGGSGTKNYACIAPLTPYVCMKELIDDHSDRLRWSAPSIYRNNIIYAQNWDQYPDGIPILLTNPYTDYKKGVLKKFPKISQIIIEYELKRTETAPREYIDNCNISSNSVASKIQTLLGFFIETPDKALGFTDPFTLRELKSKYIGSIDDVQIKTANMNTYYYRDNEDNRYDVSSALELIKNINSSRRDIFPSITPSRPPLPGPFDPSDETEAGTDIQRATTRILSAKKTYATSKSLVEKVQPTFIRTQADDTIHILNRSAYRVRSVQSRDNYNIWTDFIDRGAVQGVNGPTPNAMNPLDREDYWYNPYRMRLSKTMKLYPKGMVWQQLDSSGQPVEIVITDPTNPQHTNMDYQHKRIEGGMFIDKKLPLA